MAHNDLVFDIYTNLPPDKLNEVGMWVYRTWLAFAMGRIPAHDRKIMYPTGRYARSIHYRRAGVSRVAVVADPKQAPEALILETGHREYNMLQALQRGRAYPMHRSGPWQIGQGNGMAQMWAHARIFTGYASTPRDGKPHGRNTSNTGPAWTIPAMPAYSPAKILSDLVQKKFGRKQLPAPFLEG